MDRFLCKKWWKITPHKNGDWVKYSDVMAEIAELKRQYGELVNHSAEKIAELKKKNHGLKAYNLSLQKKLALRVNHDAEVSAKAIREMVEVMKHETFMAAHGRVWAIETYKIEKYANKLEKGDG